jgi:hypothetical protein
MMVLAERCQGFTGSANLLARSPVPTEQPFSFFALILLKHLCFPSGVAIAA